MKKLIAIVLMAVLLVSVVGCGKQEAQDNAQETTKAIVSAPPSADVVAKIDDKEIDLATYAGAYKMLEMSYARQYGEDVMERDINGRKLRDIIKRELLSSLVEEVLVIDKLKAEGFAVEDAAVDENYKQFVEFVGIDDAKMAELAEQGIDEAFIKNRIRMQMYLLEYNRRINQSIIDTIDLEAPEIASEIVKVEAQHILVETLDEANDVIERLNAGEAFEDLAKELSKDPGSGANGGSVGQFGRGIMVKPFEEAAFAMSVGDVSEPVETQFGFHVIKLNKKISIADLKNAEDGAEQLEQIKAQKAEAEFAEEIEKEIAALRQSHTVYEYPDNIAAVGLPAEPAATEPAETESTEAESTEIETESETTTN